MLIYFHETRVLVGTITHCHLNNHRQNTEIGVTKCKYTYLAIICAVS